MVITLVATTERPSGGQVVLPISEQVLRQGYLLLSDCKGFENGKRYSSIDLQTLDVIEITRTHAIPLQFPCMNAVYHHHLQAFPCCTVPNSSHVYCIV
jgi:hypothetical protein